ncbi:MAG TPA: Mur ligase family protein, partial [Dongiaceae bacterium]
MTTGAATGGLPTGSECEIEIRGLSADSRKIEPGFLFAALPGSKADGRGFIAEAAAKGAVAVLAPAGTELPPGIALVADANPRRRLALMAARFFARQPRIVAAVTGTSGKTSTAEFTRQIWRLLGRRAASLGTLGLVAPAGSEYLSLTTLDPIDLHRRLAGLADSGIDHLAMEASSHGLDQFRLDGVKIAASAFTNLSRDHLDYHGTMAAYLASKQRLFAEVMASGSMAVLNRDAPEFAQLAAASSGHGHRLITFGRQGGDLRLAEQQPEAEGQRLVIE